MSTTYTSTVFVNQQPKATHVGDQSVSGQIMVAAAVTVGDVYFLAKIPHGATIVEVIEDHSVSAATGFALDFGLATGYPANDTISMSCFISGGAAATVNRRNVVGVPVTISLSDLNPIRYAILAAKVASGSGTSSTVVNFTVVYRTDGT